MPARSGPGSAEQPRGEAADPESAGVGRGWGAVERPTGGGDRSPAATASQAEKVGIIRALSGFSFTEEQVAALRQAGPTAAPRANGARRRPDPAAIGWVTLR